jgi:ABC-2 type transport system permease protein
MSSLLKTLIIFGLEFLRIIFYVLVAFALSAAFRSRSLATGFSLFILLVGGGIVRILAMYFAWGKYLPFGRDNFAYLVTNGSPIQGVTLLSAMVLTAIYALVFAFIGYFVFQKRDI